MLHAGLDPSRLDVCLVNDAGELVAQLAAAPDADGLAPSRLAGCRDAGADGDRVDERGAVRARHARPPRVPRRLALMRGRGSHGRR